MLAHLCHISPSEIPPMLLSEYFALTDFIDAYLEANSTR